MNFSNIPAHDNVKRQLTDMVITDRIPHAILLHGPSGIGKFLVARAFAQLVHCENPGPGGESCGHCRACVQHETFNHIDTHFVFPVVKTDKIRNPISDDYIDEFRHLMKTSPYMDFEKWSATFDKKNAKPVIYVHESEAIERRLALTTAGSRYKIVMIWLPEKMNEQAANKLLKIIEEPFHDTIFLLISDDASAILPTIYSRCRPIEMHRLSDDTVTSLLIHRAAIEPDIARAIAHTAEGDVNRAFRAIDATSSSRLFFDYFITLMRRAYQRDVKDLRRWANDLAALGREQQINFYNYAQRLIRENFIYNFSVPQLNYLTAEEQNFSRNFARFISENNAEKIILAMNQATEDIAGNAAGKIVNFDFAIKMIIYIKNFRPDISHNHLKSHYI